MVDNLITATSLREAVKNKDNRSAYLAGGTEINRLGSTVKARNLISIGRIKDLDGITKDADSVRIGAMCTFQDIIESNDVPEYLKEACRFMGSRTKRNMATIGGNIALRRTDSYLYATLLACGAKLDLMGPGGRKDSRCVCCYLHKYEQFKDHLILAVRVPSEAVVYSKRYSNTEQSHAVLTVSMGMTTWCQKAQLRLAVAAKDTALTRLDDIAEAMVHRQLSDEEILMMLKADKELRFRKDIYGSPEYKRYLLAVTIADLAKEIRGGQR